MIRTISTKIMTVLCAVFVVVHISVGLLALDRVYSPWPVWTAMVIYLPAPGSFP